MSVSILHEDAAIVVLDKPSGLCVIPPRGTDARDCLRHLVEQRLGAKVWVVHRIDRDTSGIVVMARTAEAHQVLNDAFAARAVAKTYHALVGPAPAAASGVIDAAITAGRKGRMRPARPGEEGLEARTEFEVLERFGAPPGTAALVAFRPVTGRQHQIRVHARLLGSPILGDRLYAPRGERDRFARLMLHAHHIRFAHPVGGAEVTWAAPHPPDFDAARQRLAAV